MAGMKFTERRKGARHLQRYLVHFEDAGELRFAFTQDVSAHGLFLKTRLPPPPGTPLRLLIRTYRGSRTRTGTVVWTRMNFAAPGNPAWGSGVGIRFHEAGRKATSGD
ncbi:MAG: PilZ domain-containing protein [Acidobacteriota bacterium]